MRQLMYDQAKGTLSASANDNGEASTRLGRGYSGQPPYVNQTEAEGLRARGPIPRGKYRIGKPFDHTRLGPLSFYLEPYPGTDMFGRSGFFIHGDNAFGNQTASHGCIILSRSIRMKIIPMLPADLVVM